MTTVETPLIRDRVAALVREAVARSQGTGFLPSVALPEVTIERPPKLEQGDFATNFALRAKRAVGPRGPSPMDIASTISAHIAHDPPSYLAGVEAAAPGFLNFTLADDWLREQVNTIPRSQDRQRRQLPLAEDAVPVAADRRRGQGHLRLVRGRSRRQVQ